MAWTLAASLLEQNDLLPWASGEQLEQKITQLEELPKLRAISVLAFLMLPTAALCNIIDSLIRICSLWKK
jgi:hypothetical protein